MSLLVGPAMLDSKLFVSRLHNPVPDLYERYWDGVEWIWVSHGRPGGTRMGDSAPGAAMLGEKLFVVTQDGTLWERHWRSSDRHWAWEEHGRPEGRPIRYGPAAAMMDSKFFVVTDDGNLWERHWNGDRWAWEDHGRPKGKRIMAAPGAAMMDEKLFVVVEDGNLWERHWTGDRWAWEDHGRPEGKRLVTAPGAEMMNEKLFVVADSGELWERHWTGSAWAWENHGRPGGRDISGAPGAAMMDEKLFVVTDDGSLWERHWRGDRWAWQEHGQPPDAAVTGPPGAAMMDSKLFVAGRNNHLFERNWTGSEWKWVDHGTAFHDDSAHIIGAPGTEPKLEIAVLGDGFAESDMDTYRSLVEERVRAAFLLDQLGDNVDALRVTRIDVVSPVSGVTERDYDEMGTPEDSDDDVLLFENFRFSRLGLIATGLWSHCWIEISPTTFTVVENIVRRFAPAATQYIVLVNSDRPGGCNRGALASFTIAEAATTVAHELGHNLFDLGDEYNNDTLNNTSPRSEPNLTEELADWTTLKWRDLVLDGTPIPTDINSLPAGWNDNLSVGAFEGGGSRFATGIFRPVVRCRMNQNRPPWCPVCARQIEAVLEVFR